MDLTPVFQAAGQEWNVDPALLQAVAGQETGGTANPDQAVSPKGAQGRMQIMPATAGDLGVTDPTDPVQSIYAGAKYMSQLLDRYQHTNDPVSTAVAAYNAGPGRIDDVLAGKTTLPAETVAYVPGIANRYKALTASQQSQPAPQNDNLAAKMQQLRAAPSPQATPAPAPAAPPVAAYDPFADVPAPAASTAGKAASPAYDPFQAADAAPVAAAPAAPATPTGPVDEFGLPVTAIDPTNNAVTRVIGAAATGAAQAFGSEPIGLSQGQQNSLQSAGVYPPAQGVGTPLQYANKFGIVGPLAAAGDLALRSGNALIGAYQGGVSQAGVEAGQPQLGRDLAALPEAFPTGDVKGGTAIPVPTNKLGVTSQPLQDLHPPYVTPQFADNPLMASAQPAVHAARATPSNALDARAPTSPVPGIPQPTSVASGAASVPDPSYTPGGPQPGMGGPVPQSAGAAATPGGVAALTPAQELAYRSTAEGQKLLEPQQVGVPDRNLYVPGVQPNSAELEQSVNTARELKALNVTSPAVSQQAREVAADNNTARQQYIQGIAGSPVDVENMIAARSAQAQSDLDATWANKQPADPQPLFDAASTILASPDGRRPIVRNAVNSVLNEMQDSDGAPITDPELLYGVRKHIDDLMSKEAATDDPKSVRASANLQDLKSTLDNVITQATPGANGAPSPFQTYLDNFSSASRPIETMQALQDMEPKLYDSQNRMTYNKVQTMMRQIVDSRQSPGLNAFKSIPDDTMQQLWALRDDLRRSASAQELARTPGSDTVQTGLDVARQLGTMGGNLVAHGVANYFAPGVGSLGVNAVKNVTAPFRAAKVARQQATRGNQLLYPDTSQLRNPLLDPP